MLIPPLRPTKPMMSMPNERVPIAHTSARRDARIADGKWAATIKLARSMSFDAAA